VYEGAVGIPRGGMHNHARWLVDDDQVCILKADIERDRLRDRRGVLNLRENYDEILVVSHAQRGVAQNGSLMDDLAGFDQPLDPRPRELRQMLRQDAIEPLSGIGFAGPDHDCGADGRGISGHWKLGACARSKSSLASWA